MRMRARSTVRGTRCAACVRALVRFALFLRVCSFRLRNLGNTCFVGSVLQCAVHTPLFIESLEKCRDKDHGKSFWTGEFIKIEIDCRPRKCRSMSTL